MLYSIKLYIDIVILIKFASKVSLISVLYFLNGAQFLNGTFVLLLPSVTAKYKIDPLE